MTAQDLKNSILQLAMQGKLVPQDPNDEPASELLKRIKAEKAWLIKEGRNKKQKQLPLVTVEDITFDIPENWEWERFGNVVNLLSGQDMTPSEYNSNGSGMPYITGASNIDGQDIVINRWTDCAKAIAHEGDLLLTCKGTVGKIAVLKEKNVHIARQIMAITPIGFDIEFSKLFLENQVIHLKLKAKSLIPGIERDNVLNLCIPIPPLAEQKRIVAKIEELLPLVERYDESEKRLLELNKKFPDELRKAILQQAVQGKLTEQDPHDEPASELLKRIKAEKARLIKEGKIKKEKPLPPISEEEIPFDIPESWEWVRFSDVIDVRDGTHDTPIYTLTGVPLVTSKNLVNGNIDFSTTKLISFEDAYSINLRSAVADGDILFAMIGTVGNPVHVKKDREFCIKNMALFKAIDQRMLEMKYLLLFLQFEQYNMKRKASGGVQAFVSLNFLRNYLLPLPPLKEQKLIVDRVKEILPLCDSLE
jgi:type I restriction enzyme S subunit